MNLKAPLLVVVLFSAVFGCATGPSRAGEQNPPPEGNGGGETFPGYRPKLSQDTLLDYRPSLSQAVLALPEAKRSNLATLVRLLDEYRSAAAAHPGRVTAGRIELGAEAGQYEPSDEELLLSEVGERIALVTLGVSARELADSLKAAGIARTSVSYGKISFRHVDVMGSGRFFYASRPEAVTVRLR